MKGYFDFHCHILPGVDDGAKDMEETNRMLSIAYEEGIRVIVATPHYAVGTDNASYDMLIALSQEVNQSLARSGKELQIIFGNEIMYSIDIIEELQSGHALTIDGTRYILIEFMSTAIFKDIREGLNQLIYAGYIPVLAHTERYHCLINNPHLVEELVRIGAYIQVNFSCLTKSIFSPKKRLCIKLFKMNYIHFLGTDAHGIRGRAPYIHRPVKILRRKFGEAAVRRLLWDNPMTMLEDKHL